MNKHKLIFIFLIGAILSCKTKEEVSLDKLLGFYDYQISLRQNVIMIIPIDGCGKCILPSIKFVNEKSNLNNLLIVAPTLEKKKYEMFFSDEICKKHNFIADLNCISEQLNLVGTAPEIYFLDKGRISEKITITEENSETVFKKITIWK